MPRERKGLYGLGGLSFIVSGLMFFTRYVLDLVAGPPPSSGLGILAWARSGNLPLALASEALFIAGMFLIPAVIALYVSLAGTDRTKAATGCGILAAAIPILFALDIVHARLVYPVFDLRIRDPDVAELVVGVFYGGLHAVGIMMGAATIVLSLAMRRGGYGRSIAYLGIVTGVFDVVGSYPWAIAPSLLLVSQALFAAWFLAVGSRLHWMSRRAC